jgi:DNA-binding NarL/FixJ family response regulator
MTKRTEEDNSWIPAGAERALWSALVVDAGVAVKVVSADGVILWANEAFADLVGAADAASLMGKSPSDYLPADFALETLTVMRSVSLSGESAMLRTIWAGRPVMGLIRRLSGDEGRIVVTIRPELPSDVLLRRNGEFRFHQAAYADEGRLALLSVRERSVLALIGAGLSTAQIARTLDRSVKTIENQRNSLGRKLNVANRVELARIAIETGLAPAPGQGPRRRPVRRAARN